MGSQRSRMMNQSIINKWAHTLWLSVTCDSLLNSSHWFIQAQVVMHKTKDLHLPCKSLIRLIRNLKWRSGNPEEAVLYVYKTMDCCHPCIVTLCKSRWSIHLLSVCFTRLLLRCTLLYKWRVKQLLVLEKEKLHWPVGAVSGVDPGNTRPMNYAYEHRI